MTARISTAAAIAVIIAAALTAALFIGSGIARAEDSPEQLQAEAEKKVNEAIREANKKIEEAQQEGGAALDEALREANKTIDEANREAAKALRQELGTTTADDAAEGRYESEEAREFGNRISSFVQSLLNTTAVITDTAMGEAISQIAKEQKEAAEKTAEAIDEVKSRSPFVVFLIGTDYKNLGELRSTIAKTENHINQLTNMLLRNTEADVQAELDAEIQILEAEKQRLSTIVKENESKKSIFGWLVKLFQ